MSIWDIWMLIYMNNEINKLKLGSYFVVFVLILEIILPPIICYWSGKKRASSEER